MGKSLLILKKNRALARELKSFLEENLWEVELGHSLREGIGLLRKSRFDVVLADYLLGDGPVSALTDLRESAFPDTRLIVVGVPPQKKRKPGDFLFKETLPTPFTLDQLKRKLDDVLDHSGSNHEPGSEQSGEKVQIVGESQAIKTIIEMIETFSNTDITVLITGESGTGKELVARALHQGSWRSGGPFVPLNCAAIPGELLESELFGHESGAFTDAKSMRKGKLQHADKGTFFLDEIGEMSHTLQAKLLRVLETKEVERLGSNGSITVDTRFVAATNAILTEKIQQGLFREDLYYRLRMVEIHVPPLRERKVDVIPLCEFFLQSSVEKLDLCQKRLGRDAQDLLVSYNWPGNARELRNVIEVAALLSRDRSELTKQDFPHLAHFSKETVSSNVRVRLPEDGINLNEFLAEVETDLIRQSLERSEGNKKKAAELLCLKRTTLVEKIRRTGLHADQNAM